MEIWVIILRTNIIKYSLLSLALLISGCSSVVSKYISSQQSFNFENISSDESLAIQGYVKSKYCSKINSICISYLEAKPFINKSTLRYDVAIDVSKKTENVTLEITKNDVSTDFRGTIVLLHGFKASKEFMTNSALYFRFIGFNVIIPDLLGHGDSDGEVSFGVKDSQIIHELLKSKLNIEYPLYLLGNSMGAVTASYLASNNDISGLILLAPMIKFDEAAVNYALSYSPIISTFFPKETIRQGAIEALNKANVSVEQTNIKPIISGLNVPVIIFASTNDQVAPFSYFDSFSNIKVSVIKVNDRSHPSMSIIGTQEHLYIQEWLKSKANKPIKQD